MCISGGKCCLTPVGLFRLNMYHFLLHGFHHKYPQDALRLVFPPVLLAALAIPVRILVLSLFPVGVGHAAMAGLFHGYVGYDLCHFALHFQNLTSSYFQDLKVRKDLQPILAVSPIFAMFDHLV